MLAHGVDIIEISRVRRAIETRGDRFLRRLYTENEIAHCGGRMPELAARFAGKEAVMKALGTGHRGISPREIEILSDGQGAPLVRLEGNAQARALEMGIRRLVISLSHCRGYAIASVVGEGE